MVDELPDLPARATDVTVVVERRVNSFMAKEDAGSVMMLGWKRLVLYLSAERCRKQQVGGIVCINASQPS